MKKAYLFLMILFCATALFAREKQVVLQIKQASDDLEEWLDPSAQGGTDYASSDLELGYEKGAPQLIAVRFQDIKIPQGRTIKSAYLQFELDDNAKTVDPFALHIWAENVDSAATYNGAASVAYALTNRVKSVDSVLWTIPTGDFNLIDQKYNSSDLKTLVQQLVNRSGWKASNAMAFYLKGTGCREVEAFEGEATAAAKLFITYEMTAADSIAEVAAMRKKEVAIQITQGSDDMEEWLDPIKLGGTDTESSDLELGNEKGAPQLIAVRFPNIPVGKKRIITNAYIQFELDASSTKVDPFNLYVRTENADSAATYSSPTSIAYELTNRVKSNDSILWNIPTGDFNAIDQKYNTVNLTPLVQKMVDRDGWKAGNAIAFYLRGTGCREVEAFEGEKTAAAKLFVTYAMQEEDIAQNVIDSLASSVYGKLTTSLDSMVNVISGRVSEADFTVPSWTLYKRAEVDYKTARVLLDTLALSEAQLFLEDKEMPFNVNMTINGDPKTRMGFTWYTNLGVVPGAVQIVAGNNVNETAFATPAFSFNADTLGIRNLNYCTGANGLAELAGIANNSKRNYTSHKALAQGLAANTTYSYRVGTAAGWSEIGTFTTAPTGSDFSFIYITDTQANTDEMFAISAKTIEAAATKVSDAKFCMVNGDMVETSGASNGEWEWEQWFETNGATWANLPITPVCGNHDASPNKNLTNHFNTQKVGFDQTMSTSPGSVYSFVYGDALFIALSTENYGTAGYLDSMKNYIRREVAAHPNVKWKVAFYHKAIYTGSSSHQSDADAKTVREALVPVFDEVGIDVALQGHDHVYEVIGATKNFALVANASKDVQTVTGGVRENMTGKEGGIYNVKNGTLFFLNNSAGKKKYEARTKAQMDAAATATGITNYYGMFTGKFGQTGEPTFSDVKVTADTLTFTTYTVNDAGTATQFDSFKVVKTDNFAARVTSIKTGEIKVWPNPATDVIKISGVDKIDGAQIYDLNGSVVLSSLKDEKTIKLQGLASGVYLLKVKAGSSLYVEQIMVK